MKIVLISYGSRGDVQPYLALARGLRHVGHEARLVAPPTFAALAGEYGVPFFPAGVDLQAHLATLKPKESDRRENPIATLRRLRDHIRSIFDAAARDSWAACQGSELVIGIGAAAD
ncbi:MAG TPA: glycosyltransferase, partial [Herpetosiphonaceae bacterium]